MNYSNVTVGGFLISGQILRSHHVIRETHEVAGSANESLEDAGYGPECVNIDFVMLISPGIPDTVSIIIPA